MFCMDSDSHPVEEHASNDAAADSFQLDVVISFAPDIVWQKTITLPLGSSLLEARQILENQYKNEWPELAPGLLSWGVWGRIQPDEYALQQGDRLEAFRGLIVDPKVARRERFAKQGSRSAGLFSK